MSCEKACGVGGNNNKSAKNKKPDVRMHAALLCYVSKELRKF
jgi:hypothetical protein